MTRPTMALPNVYCVHLASSTARRARMERRLLHHGLLAHTRFVEAIAATHTDVIDEWKQRASVACSASHLKAMRAMLDDPQAAEHGGIICEDDVLLHNDFTARFHGVRENLPSDAPFCSLGYLISSWQAGLRWAGRNPERRNLCAMVPSAIWGTHMYWISRDYAQAVVSRYDREAEQLPAVTETIAHASNGFIAYPPLALQDVIDSTIRPHDELVDFHLSSQRAWIYDDYSAAEDGHHESPLREVARRQQSIALCMIVKNEAKIIERCLWSARPLIDSWVICDTGSDDGTPELVEQVLGDLPGVLHRAAWRDFGSNRSELMQLAQGKADYLLLLDADMTVDLKEPLPALTADAYMIRHKGSLDYAVPRLVRGDRRWRYEGSTHEYIATDPGHTQEELDELVVEHHADGASRGHKLERDADLLGETLRTDPDNERAVFYLAQTYRDLGERGRAIDLYRHRAGLGGFGEEAFYALYQAGMLTAQDDELAAIPLLVEAAKRRPTRAEPLYELAQISRSRGWHEAAYKLAERGLQMPYPDDLLFVHRWVYEWGMRFEFAVAACFVGDFEAGLEANERLLSQQGIPAEYEEAARQNHAYCRERLRRRRLPQHNGEIAIFAGRAWETWSPSDIETRGLGGSETAAVRLAEQLSLLGHAVTVYGEFEGCVHYDVSFRHWSAFDPAAEHLALISSRIPETFDEQIAARSRILWLHDVDCGPGLTEQRAAAIDHVMVLSGWHRQYVAEVYPFLKGKLRQMRNGIEPGYFENGGQPRRGRVVCSSAPDRGLGVLLELWPEIVREAPDAELGYCYYAAYDAVAGQQPRIADHLKEIRELAEQPGVKCLGSLTQPQLAHLMCTSLVWAHPSYSTLYDAAFFETSCIGAMEAQAAGCLAVASPWGALRETVKVGRLVEGQPLSERWRAGFVAAILEGLTDPATQQWAQLEGPRAAEDFGWRPVAEQVAALIDP